MLFWYTELQLIQLINLIQQLCNNPSFVKGAICKFCFLVASKSEYEQFPYPCYQETQSLLYYQASWLAG